MDSSSVVRILSFNIHKGVHYLYRRGVKLELIRSIEESKAEWVFLQEVRGSHDFEETHLEFLADSIWQYHAYGRNAITGKNEHHGNAILSADPILEFTNFDLSLSRFERRGCLLARVERSGKTIYLANTHLNLRSTDRYKQVLKMIDFLDSEVPRNLPLVLAGDFNDWLEELNPILHQGLSVREAFEFLTGRSAKTYPSFFPYFRLDRIFLRGLHPTRAQVLDESRLLASDHRAIWVECRL